MENKLIKMSNKGEKQWLETPKCWIIIYCAFQKGLFYPEVLMDQLLIY